MPDKKITNQKENNMKQIKDIIKEQAILFYKEKSKGGIKESKVQTKDQKPKQKSQKKVLKEAEDLDRPKVTDTDVTSAQNEIPEVNPETPKEDIFSGIKEELSSKLADFASHSDNLEEIFENREQIEISMHYERLPKATLIATEEFLADKVYFRNPEKEKRFAEGFNI